MKDYTKTKDDELEILFQEIAYKVTKDPTIDNRRELADFSNEIKARQGITIRNRTFLLSHAICHTIIDEDLRDLLSEISTTYFRFSIWEKNEDSLAACGDAIWNFQDKVLIISWWRNDHPNELSSCEGPTAHIAFYNYLSDDDEYIDPLGE